MASQCYNLWRKYVNSKGLVKWVNEGPAPDGVCPSCSLMQIEPDGTWNGVTAACQGNNIVKVVANGLGQFRQGDVIVYNSVACNNSVYVGEGSIRNYFP